MKKLIIALCLSLTATTVLAFSLDDALSKLGDNAKEDLKNEGKVSLNGLADGVKDEANKKIAEIEERINGKIEQYEEKINGEIDGVVSDVKGKIAEVEAIKNKAEALIENAKTIISFVKIFLAILSFSTLAIIFFIWKAYRRISNLYKLLDNVRSYKDIEQRVAALESN